MHSVLICVSYTDFKYYARNLYPQAAAGIDWPNKELLLVTDVNCPGLSQKGTGDVICAEGRAFGIEKAIRENFDWIMFLDLDLIPDPQCLRKLLACEYPFVGGCIAARGDPGKIIGHNYLNLITLSRKPIQPSTGLSWATVDGISGAMMLVHKSVFKRADYKGYTGVHCIPGRTTCDDEYYCLQVKEKCNIQPLMCFQAGGWHLHDDGYAYTWPDSKTPYTLTKNSIIFQNKIYEAGE